MVVTACETRGTYRVAVRSSAAPEAVGDRFPRSDVPHLVLAAEGRPSTAAPSAGTGGDAAAQPGRSDPASERAARDAAGDPLALFTQALDALQARHPDELDEAEIGHELETIERGTRRLQARTARLAGALANRQASRAVEADEQRGRRVGAGRVAQQAVRDVQRQLADELDWTPSQAKRAVDLGRRLTIEGGSDDTRAAFDAGDLSDRHVSLLTDTLRWFDDPQVHDEVEQELLAAARNEDAVAFGRTCRRVLAERDHAAAMTAEERRRSRRRVSLWQTEDGMTACNGQWSGLDAEYVATGIDAFRRPDAPGERRTPQQATADAVVAMARAALDAGQAPSEHGIRPHVIVDVRWESILDGCRGRPDPLVGAPALRRDPSAPGRLRRLAAPDRRPRGTDGGRGRDAQRARRAVPRAVGARPGVHRRRLRRSRRLVPGHAPRRALPPGWAPRPRHGSARLLVPPPQARPPRLDGDLDRRPTRPPPPGSATS
jgi:hypothetical protein